MFHRFMDSTIGLLEIVANEHAVTEIRFSKERVETHSNAICEACVVQLQEYFEGKRTSFSIPLEPQRTEFQQKVYQALCEIPYGETRSYQDIAICIGNPNACRAVGLANNVNPIPIIIPCHRVIGKNGKLVGYAGGLDMKMTLLQLEKGTMK